MWIDSINRIYLSLGKACNFHCKYCLQHPFHPDIKDSIDPKLIQFLEDLAKRKDEQGVKVTLNFFGGEPLLYWDYIEQIVNHFKDKFFYGAISNGSLLTQKMVDFLNEHEIFFTLSNDGPRTLETRDKNMIEDPEFLKLFKQIKKRGVDGVITSSNPNPLEFEKYIRQFDKEVIIYTETLKCMNPDMDMKFVDKDLHSYASYLKTIKQDVLDNFKKGMPSRYLGRFSNYLQLLQDNMLKENLDRPLRCGILSTVLDLDINGKIYICHNSDYCIGEISSNLDDLELVHQKGLNIVQALKEKEAEGKGCTKCAYHTECKSFCILEKSSPAQRIECNKRRVIWGISKQLYNELNEVING